MRAAGFFPNVEMPSQECFAHDIGVRDCGTELTKLKTDN